MHATPAVPIDILRLREDAERSRYFREVEAASDVVRCHAHGVDAWYEVRAAGGSWVVRLLMADRWLSESIESDLMHGRESLEDLVSDELIDLGCAHTVTKVRHFRDDQKRYVFEADIPAPADAYGDATTLALQFLLAFESSFRQLGEMGGDRDDGE